MSIQRSDSLKAQAYKIIKDDMLAGRIDRETVYSEQWFATRLQISRTPVREAILQLRNEGLIEALPNRGIRIKKISIEEARSLSQMRIAIEGYSAFYLAEHIGEAKFQKAVENLEKIIAKSQKEYNRINGIQFHQEMVDCICNSDFSKQYKAMRAKIDLFWDQCSHLDNRQEASYKEHQAILSCIKKGDGAAAFKSVNDHLEILIAILEKQPSAD